MGEVVFFYFRSRGSSWYRLSTKSYVAVGGFSLVPWAGFLATGYGHQYPRDRRGDKEQGKKTLAVKLGDRGGELLPMLFISASILLFLAYALHRDVYLLGLVASIIMIKIVHSFIRPLIFPRAVLLNKALKSTSVFVVLYCLLYSIVAVI